MSNGVGTLRKTVTLVASGVSLFAFTSVRADVIRTYSVTHSVSLTPGGNILPTVTAKHYEHAYVSERGSSGICEEDLVFPTQPMDWEPYGSDKLRPKAKVRNSGPGGFATDDTAIAAVPIPSTGFASTLFTLATAATPVPACGSVATASSTIAVSPFVAGGTITGTITSAGTVTATTAPPRHRHRAYAFSMAALEAKGGRLLRDGTIRLGRTMRDQVSGSARATTFLKDPIEFIVEDLVTQEIVEGTLHSVDLEVTALEDGAGFVWENDQVDVAADTDVVFVIDQDNAFVSAPGFLELQTLDGLVTVSEDTGDYDGVLPAVGTPLPLSFSLASEVVFDFDLGDFDGHDLDVTLTFSENGDGDSPLGELIVPAVSEWGLLALAILILCVGTIVLRRGGGRTLSQ